MPQVPPPVLPIAVAKKAIALCQIAIVHPLLSIVNS